MRHPNAPRLRCQLTQSTVSVLSLIPSGREVSSWELPQLTAGLTGSPGGTVVLTRNSQSVDGTSSDFTCQISSLYSRTARSDEKRPMRATLRIAF